jgi:hypothetical protein
VSRHLGSAQQQQASASREARNSSQAHVVQLGLTLFRQTGPGVVGELVFPSRDRPVTEVDDDSALRFRDVHRDDAGTAHGGVKGVEVAVIGRAVPVTGSGTIAPDAPTACHSFMFRYPFETPAIAAVVSASRRMVR